MKLCSVWGGNGGFGKEAEMKSDLWYALKVRPRFERVVVAHLRSRGYDPFLPTYITKRQWSDRIKSLELPLFPGYLFCQIDLRSRLPILTAPGVNYIVGMGRAPEPVAEQEIESIRAIVGSGLYYEPYPYLTAGQLVRVEHGALVGLIGRVVDVKSSSRLIVSINLLMRSVSAEIDRSWVEPVDNLAFTRHLRVERTTPSLTASSFAPFERKLS
jgi:transcription antitermination factor NusG